jgi:hypothetical protein
MIIIKAYIKLVTASCEKFEQNLEGNEVKRDTYLLGILV